MTIKQSHATLNGKLVSDIGISLSDSDEAQCSTQVFLIESQTNLSGFDGILGLAPPCNEAPRGFIQSEHNFLKALYTQYNSYNTEYAGFTLRLSSSPPTITFAEPSEFLAQTTWSDVSLYKDRDYSECEWTIKYDGLYYDQSDIKTSTSNLAVVDSGFALIMLENKDYRTFKQKLEDDIAEIDCSGLYCFSEELNCDEL